MRYKSKHYGFLVDFWSKLQNKSDYERSSVTNLPKYKRCPKTLNMILHLAFWTGFPICFVKFFGEEFLLVKGKVLIFGTNIYPCSCILKLSYNRLEMFYKILFSVSWSNQSFSSSFLFSYGAQSDQTKWRNVIHLCWIPANVFSTFHKQSKIYKFSTIPAQGGVWQMEGTLGTNFPIF